MPMVGGGGGAAKGTKRKSWRGEFGGSKGNAIVMEAEGRGPLRRRKCSIVLDIKEDVLKMSIHFDNWKVTYNLDKAPMG